MRNTEQADRVADDVFPLTASSLLLLGRVMLSLPFLAVGFGQIIHFAQSCEIVRLLGFPLAQPICLMGIALNLSGSVSLVLGYKSRAGIILLAAALLPVTFLLHFSAEQKINFLRNVAVLGGLIPFFVLGPGELSLDRSGGRRCRA